MIDLTAEQHAALNGEYPPRVRDPQTEETYVLIRADVYERMRRLLDSDTRRASWDDEALDAYEQYRPKERATKADIGYPLNS